MDDLLAGTLFSLIIYGVFNAGILSSAAAPPAVRCKRQRKHMVDRLNPQPV
jgi:hypothetical protein